jgi:hypothetical protein
MARMALFLWTRSRTLIAVAAVIMTCACGKYGAVTDASVASSGVRVPPPAVSAIDDTVSVHWELADSFDVLPDGACAGRGDNRWMRNGARVLLRGNTSDFYTETRATAYFKHFPSVIYHGKPLMNDDYLYCIVDAVFAPSMPDPSGYSVKFQNASEEWLGKPGGTPFGRPDHPGYGSYRIRKQTCQSLLAPPDEECPEW